MYVVFFSVCVFVCIFFTRKFLRYFAQFNDKTIKVAYTMSNQRPFQRFEIIFIQMSEITEKLENCTTVGKN